MNYAVIQAIILKKCYEQKLCEHCEELNINETEEYYRGMVAGLNWVLDLINAEDEKIESEFRDLINIIYDSGSGKNGRL